VMYVVTYIMSSNLGLGSMQPLKEPIDLMTARSIVHVE
jgi:hypothetical protein